MGNPDFRRRGWIAACAIGLTLFTAGISAGEENLYKFRQGGRGFYGYEDALIALDISNGTVTGQLRPLLGDKTSPVSVRGTNPRDGVLELVIDLPAGPQTYKFTKKIVGQRIVWKSIPIDGVESNLSIYRRLDGPLPDAALTLGEYECGASYRWMMAEFLPEATEERLNAFLATDQQASSLPVIYNTDDEKTGLSTKKTSISLGDFLKLELSGDKADKEVEHKEEEHFSVPFQFETPVGTEVYLAKWLRGSGLFKLADLDSGGCDGMDASYFEVDRALLFDGEKISRAKFEQYIGTRLRDFVSRDEKGKAWQFRMGQPLLKVLSLPTNPLAYRVRLYVASEITRHEPGWWDSFWVTFEPGPPVDTEKEKHAVVVTVDRLKGSKRSFGNSSPPDDAYFTKELELKDEAEVTAGIAYYFAHRDRGSCFVQLAGDEAEKHHVVCNGVAAR